jgi:hypothetical protein
MADRSTILAYMAVLLGQMEELALRDDLTPNQAAETAGPLREQWNICVRKLDLIRTHGRDRDQITD